MKPFPMSDLPAWAERNIREYGRGAIVHLTGTIRALFVENVEGCEEVYLWNLDDSIEVEPSDLR